MSSGSRPDRRVRASSVGWLRGVSVLDRLGDRLDVVRRRAAAAADDVQCAIASELAQDAGGFRRLLVVAAEGVGQARVGVAADRDVGDASQFLDVGPEHGRAPSEQLRPIANGRAWRTLFQKAPTVWPVSVRPDASVIVPLMITGRR